MSAATLSGTIAGANVRLLAERALFVEASRTLVVADLHWGKSETFRAHGIPLPEGVLDADLARLARAIERCEAERLVVLGDLVHAREGITPALVERIAAWRRAHPVPAVLVRGNHDRHLPRLPAEWALDDSDDALVDPPFAWMHDASEPPPAIAYTALHRVGGHLHPLVALEGGGDALRLPAFVIEPQRTVLPAFSEFTAGVTFRRARRRRIVAIAGDALADLGEA